MGHQSVCFSVTLTYQAWWHKCHLDMPCWVWKTGRRKHSAVSCAHLSSCHNLVPMVWRWRGVTWVGPTRWDFCSCLKAPSTSEDTEKDYEPTSLQIPIPCWCPPGVLWCFTLEEHLRTLSPVSNYADIFLPWALFLPSSSLWAKDSQIVLENKLHNFVPDCRGSLFS